MILDQAAVEYILRERTNPKHGAPLKLPERQGIAVGRAGYYAEGFEPRIIAQAQGVTQETVWRSLREVAAEMVEVRVDNMAH